MPCLVSFLWSFNQRKDNSLCRYRWFEFFLKKTLMRCKCSARKIMPNEGQGKTWPSQDFCCWCSVCEPQRSHWTNEACHVVLFCFFDSFAFCRWRSVCEPQKPNWANEACHVFLFCFCDSFVFCCWRSVCEPQRSNWAGEACHVVLFLFHFLLLALCLWTSKA